ncbi:MAG: asparagine synthase (glutamine-hydrolyzing) [Desulfobacteraceae bacterium]
MCGIHGIISRSMSAAEMRNRLGLMGKIQRHRGPDDQGGQVFSGSGRRVGFGFVRLSILDLETGMQPIVSGIDGSAIICNGQIYNYMSLKRKVSDQEFVSSGDIEVGLHLFRKKGIDFLQSLNGMYAGAVYSCNEKRVILFRDRFGIKPLYYVKRGEDLFFASEIKPLFEGTGERPVFNRNALSKFFAYRYVPGEETMFKGVRKLPPGSYMEIDLQTGELSVHRYWEYRFDRVNHAMTLDEAAEEFFGIFTDAVDLRLRADVEVGSFLSGGIDSSAVASLAAERKKDINLFTISFNEDGYNELPQVQNFLAAHKDRFRSATLNTALCSVKLLNDLPSIIRSVEEPVSLGTLLPTDQVCRLAGENLKVVLTGEGADEIFGGYRKFLIESAAAQFKDSSSKRQNELLHMYPELENYLSVRDDNPFRRYIQSELLFERAEIARLIGTDPGDAVFPADARPSLSGQEHPLNSALAMEARSRLPDYVILRLDKLSMRHSLETRTPFLDFRLAEFAAALPPSFKANMQKGIEKYILGYAFKKYGVLDPGTAGRRKMPFTIPLAHWISEPSKLPEPLQEIVSGSLVKEQGVLNPDVLGHHFKNISISGTDPATLVSEADRVFAVMVFTLWYNEFF